MTTEELHKLLSNGISLDNTTYLILFLVCAISGFIGAYFSSYAKQKGKNYATKEDFDSLKAQTRELTMATEKVKSEINNNSWIESKKWELKFKIYTEVLEALAVWRISINTIKKEIYNSKGEQVKELNNDKLEEIGAKIQSIFEGLAKIEAIAEIGLSSEQSKKIRALKETATQGTSEQDLNQAILTVITKIKELESELANEAKRELFE